MIKNIAQEYLPNPLYSIIATTYTILHPGHRSRIIYIKKDCWKVITFNESYYHPPGSPNRGRREKREKKYARYTADKFCSVESDDLVLDIGAFIGEFSLPAASRGKEVLAIEPDPRSFNCLSLQTANRNNITVLNELPYEEKKRIKFNSATDGSESSVIGVDKGEYVEVEMFAKPLDNILNERNISHVDFVKMDAEGAEPEVLRGIKKTTVDKFAIDVGEERDGAGTKDQVRKILEDRGYECRVINDQHDDPVLFATI